MGNNYTKISLAMIITLIFTITSFVFGQGKSARVKAGDQRALDYQNQTFEIIKEYSSGINKGTIPARTQGVVLFEESFESAVPPAGWSKLNPDGGSGWNRQAIGTSPVPGWQGGVITGPPNGGSFVAFCTWNTGGSFSNDQWLVSSQVTDVQANDSLHFYLRYWPTSFTDTLEVRISTTGNTSPADFNVLVETLGFGAAGDSSTAWRKISYRVDDYVSAGSNVYIAFRERVQDNFNDGASFSLDLVSYTRESGIPQHFAAYLNAGQEVSANPIASNGTGSGRFVLSADSTELSYEVHVRNLQATMTAAHFHNAPAGVNGGVVRNIFVGSTHDGDTTFSGVWSSSDAVQPLTPVLVAELLAGNIYVNVHSTFSPGGEIRGQVLAPETPHKLLLTEFVVTPTNGEMVEIHNPNNFAVDLTNYYLTDATFQGGSQYYYKIVLDEAGRDPGAGGGGFADWHARFPEGASIGAGEYQTVALAGDSIFAAIYGVDPTYELFEDSTDNPNDAPNMREAFTGSINRQGGLTDGDEVIITYYWDGLSDLVVDLDYVIYDDATPAINEQVDKTGVLIDGPDADSDPSGYLPDLPFAQQKTAPSPTAGFSSQRKDLSEGEQITSGGNGVTGGNETSEDLNNTWTTFFAPTPNASIPQVSLNAPRSLTAAGTFDHVDLAWLEPLPAGELGYDDGTVETPFGFGPALAGSEFAVRFTPTAYPATLLAIKVYWASVPPPFVVDDNVEYSVWVNPAGGDAPPTTEVVANTAHTVSLRDDFEEIDISAQNIQVATGDFYYSFTQIDTTNYGIGLDADGVNASRTLLSIDGGVTWFKLDQVGFEDNVVIRALVQEGSGTSARVVELAPRVFESARSTAKYPNIKEHIALAKSLEMMPVNEHNTLKNNDPAFVRGLLGYNIYRTTDGFNFDKIASVDAATLAYTDFAVIPFTGYGYQVTANYDEGESAPSNLAITATVGAPEEVVDHETNTYVASITNEGNIGWLNGFPGSGGVGSGFLFNPKTGAQRLFEGAVMVGIGPDQVSDAARDETGTLDADFVALAGIDSSNSTPAATVYGTGFADLLAENPIGVGITQVSISADTLAASNILGFVYVIGNASGVALENVYFGGFFDWDIDQPTGFFDRGQVIVDSLNFIPGVNNNQPFPIEILEMHGGSLDDAYMGVIPLSSNIFAGRRIAISADEVYPPFMTDADKWTYMTTNRAGNENGDGGSAQDHAQVFGLPPVNIEVDSAALVGFALVAGTNLTEMVNSARRAQLIWALVLGNPIEIFPVVGIEDDPIASIPTEFALEQNYPNPFNPTTTLKYALKENADVKLHIYNSLGQLVKTVVNEKQTAGYKEVVWDGTNDSGIKVASGVYIYRLEANAVSGAKYQNSRKMILLK